MPELRKDPIVGRWVVIAPERANRPSDAADGPVTVDHAYDPFLEGNEDATTPEILACRDDLSVTDGPGWRVRVIPNKFPALKVEGNLEIRRDGIYESMNGLGAHEVIIESPHYETNISRLSDEHVGEILWVYRDRLVDLKRDPRLVYALIFKNKGVLAGASLRHAHSQLIATPIVPMTIQEEMNGALEYYNNTGRSIFDDMIQQELQTTSRIVVDTPDFVAFCPYASRFPFETWILPKQQQSHYEDLSREGADDLGRVLKKVLRKLESALDDPPYNYLIHSAPFNRPELPHFRWHIEIIPRMTRVAGFEWGSGIFINPIYPERAAKLLLDADA